MTDDPVAELLLQVAQQDRAAFRKLYIATSAKLFGVSLRILRSEAEANDALQVIYTRVWTRSGRFDPTKGRGMTWLISIARNHAIDCVRSRTTEPQLDHDFDIDVLKDRSPSVETRLAAKSDLGRLNTCFELLERDRASAVKKAYLEGRSYQELADTYGVPLNTMRTWLRRSLLKLRECMET